MHPTSVSQSQLTASVVTMMTYTAVVTPLTRHDMLVDDIDKVVAIRPRVLVPEADHVTQLVHHDAELVAVLADADHLRTAATLAHERTAPATAAAA